MRSPAFGTSARLPRGRTGRARAGLALCAVLAASPAAAGPTPAFTPGNVVLTTRNLFLIPPDLGVGGWGIFEYTPLGALVQAVPIPYPAGAYPASERPRGLFVTPAGEAFVYNGTFDPYLSHYAPDTGAWDHQTYPEWSNANVGGYGSVAVLRHRAFASDMNTWHEPASGIVFFDLLDGSAGRFGETQEYRDVTAGRDGLLYANRAIASNTVDVYDPDTLAPVRTIVLETQGFLGDFRGIAVDARGYLYAAVYSGTVVAFDPDGAKVDASAPFGTNLVDIALSVDGTLVVATRFDVLLLGDRSLDTFSSFIAAGSEIPYVAFVEPPQLDASVDVRPGNPHNIVVPHTPGRIAVALLGSSAFDLGEVDDATLRFGPSEATPVRPVQAADVDGDGLEDLVAVFRVSDTGVAAGDAEACLRGETWLGSSLRGCDAIQTMPLPCGPGAAQALIVLPPMVWWHRRRRSSSQ